MNTNKIKRIPYGKGDFDAINAQNDYYVDKTRFIPLLEKTPFVFLIRPRRFGKTLFLSILHSYYDINRKDKFEELFHDTWILENPTETRASYLVLYLNFSAVNPDLNKVEESFNFHCMNAVKGFIQQYNQYLPSDLVRDIKNAKNVTEQLTIIATRYKDIKYKVYLLIDEYDNFANTIITRYGQNAYAKIIHEEGFFRYFFNVLKSAASGSGSGLARMFITGVSPITMDDVTSGFNIGDNISLHNKYSEILGFTEKDVSDMIDYYTEVGEFKLNKQETMEILSEWYNGYKFSDKASQTVYNPDMILYFIKESLGEDGFPTQLVDENIRIDYGKLRHILTVNRKLNGNFDILEQIVTEGGLSSQIVKSFPYERILDRENFVSLLFYFGLISIKEIKRGSPYLAIPNNVIRELMFNFIREGYRDVYNFNLDIYKLGRLLENMGYDGEWKECIDFIAQCISKQTRNRDLINGEQSVKALFISLMNIYEFFIPETEKEVNHGYADILLVPFIVRYQDMNYAYLIEFKYISAKEYSEEKKNSLIEKAKAQLEKYAEDDRLKKLMHAEPYGRIKLKKLIIIFKAYDMVYCGEIH